MFKSVFALLALTLLGACASFAPLNSASTAQYASFDDGPSAPVEGAVVRADYAMLDRRVFSTPSRRMPDQREVLATALDRAWRRTSYHRLRRVIKTKAA